uniref:Serpentine receptor class gamma n=1 Tax=Panagrellus redivivus TaxID=6233 RepID=A0A7E4UQM1_PANRE
MFDRENRVVLAGFVIGQSFQFVFIIFLTNEFLIKRHSQLQQAYYYVLYITYILDTLDNIAWFYYEAVGNKVGDIGVAISHVFISYYIYSIGTSSFLLSLNRFTAVAYPSVHLKFWRGKSLYIILSVTFIIPFLMEVHALTDIDCKFYPFVDKCESKTLRNLLIRTVYNTTLSVAALGIVTVAVIKAPKHSSALAKIERNTVIYTMATSILVIAYSIFYYLSNTNLSTYVVVYNIAFASFGIHQYGPMMSLLFLNSVFRKRFLQFLKLHHFGVVKKRGEVTTIM